MGILDQIQEELRDPRYSDHATRSSFSGTRDEHTYIERRLRDEEQVQRALMWLTSGTAREELKRYEGECVMLSGTAVVGHGASWGQAFKMALALGVSPNALVRVNAKTRFDRK